MAYKPNVMPEQRLGGVIILKMDVERAEYQVLKEVSASGVLCDWKQTCQKRNKQIVRQSHAKLRVKFGFLSSNWGRRWLPMSESISFFVCPAGLFDNRDTLCQVWLGWKLVYQVLLDANLVDQKFLLSIKMTSTINYDPASWFIGNDNHDRATSRRDHATKLYSWTVCSFTYEEVDSRCHVVQQVQLDEVHHESVDTNMLEPTQSCNVWFHVSTLTKIKTFPSPLNHVPNQTRISMKTILGPNTEAYKRTKA